MSERNPDRWCLIRVSEDTVKVFAMWSGGYLDGDSWSLNSGIESVQETASECLFTGHSGSTYRCRKSAYGVTAYGAVVLRGVDLPYMSSEEAERYIHSKSGQNQ